MKKSTIAFMFWWGIFSVSHAAALTPKEQTELRKALNEYKKTKSKLQQDEAVIKRFKKQYPEDSFVNEIIQQKDQFDVSMEPVIGIR